jgi:hypothetical protein
MDARDMTDALKDPHPDVPCETIGDDTITALAQLAKKLKKKFQKHVAAEISQAPIKAPINKQPSPLIQKVITSPMQHNYQTTPQNQVITAPYAPCYS